MSLDGSINDDILAEMTASQTYVVPAGNVPGEGTGGSAVLEPGKVPDIDSAIQEIAAQDAALEEDKVGAVRVSEMKDVADRVMATETISISDAEEIQRVYGGLDEAVAPVAAYSEIPTKVNLVPTQRFVADKLSDVAGQSIARHLAYVNSTYQSATNLFKLLEQHMGELLGMFEVMRERCAEDLSKASVSKRFLAFRRVERDGKPSLDGPYDLKKVCLYNQDFVSEYEAEGFLDKLPSSAETQAFRELYFSETFKSLLRASEACAKDAIISLHRAFHRDDCRESNSGVSYVDLLTLFASGKIEDILRDYIDGVTKCAAMVDAEYAKVTAIGGSDVVAWSDEFRESTEAFGDFYEMLLQLEKYRMVAYMFLYRSTPIVEGFGSAL